MLAYAIDQHRRGSPFSELSGLVLRLSLAARLRWSLVDQPISGEAAPAQARAAPDPVRSRRRLALPSLSLPKRARMLMMTGAAVVMIPPITVAATAHWRAAHVERQVTAAIQRTYAVALYDDAGHFGGVRLQPGSDSDRMIVPLRRAPPPDFFRMLRWSEDRNANFYGMDLASTGWAGLCWLGESVGLDHQLDKVRRCTGASTLLSAIAGAARGTGNTGRDFGTKAQELVDTWSISVFHDLDRPATQALIADAAPYVVGAGSEVWGYELSASVLWGQSANLSAARSAVLVTAFRRPIHISCQEQIDLAEARESWSKRVALAKLIVSKALPAGERQRAALAELDGMAPIVRPWMDDPLLAGLPWAKACLAAGNPRARANLVASSVALRVDEELARLAPGSPVLKVRVSLDLAGNQAFVNDVRKELGAIERSQGSRFDIPLTGTAGTRADALFLTTDGAGLIRRLYSGSSLDNLSAPRRTASLGKLIVLAAASDSRSRETLLCDRRDTKSDVSNADGSRGFAICAGPALVTIEKAMGRSMTLPLLDLARSIDPTRLTAAIEAFGGKIPQGVEPALAAALGLIEIAPERMVANLQAIQHGASGRKAVTTLPRIIAGAETLNGVDAGAKAARSEVNLEVYFKDPAARSFIAAGASAALKYQGGTLAGAVDSDFPLGQAEVGKTGTDTDDAGNVVAKYAAGASATYGYFGGLWAPKGPLGRDVSMTPMWRWLRTEAKRAAASPASNPAR